MRVVDSRRLRGPNLQTREPAAVAEVLLEAGERPADAVAAWRAAMAQIATVLGWTDYAARGVARPFPGGIAFALPAPVDALLEATEVNEVAIRSATAVMAGRPYDPAPALLELVERIAEHANPELIALRDEAARRDVPFLWDDGTVTLGMARYSVTYDSDDLPGPSQVSWSTLGRIPVAIVTGTNGKTTTARLLARMGKLAGCVPGNTSTDGIVIDGQVIEEGDWTGAEGARIVLRHPDVTFAILETARGGILRRGLAIDSCDAALVTNVASDHLGEFGVFDLPTMARTKAVVGSIVRPDGRVVLSGDDPLLVGLMSTFPAPVVLFSTADPAPRAHVAAGGTLYAVVRGSFARVTRDEEVLLAPVTEAPITFGGAAVHNVANALAAAAVAWSLGLRDSAVSEALRTFGAQPEDNPGRGEVVRTRRGTRVLLDFGHNPAGMRELMRLARSLVGRGGRLASVHTQPGDRTQSDSDALAREIAAGSPRRVVLWESEEYRRGRAPGDIAASLRRGLRAAGMSNRAIDDAPTERAALERALSGAGPADVVVVAPHIEHRDVGELLRGY